MIYFLLSMFGAAITGPVGVVVAAAVRANHAERTPDYEPTTGPLPILVTSVAFPADPDPDPVGVSTQPLPSYADLLSSGHHPRSHRAHR